MATLHDVPMSASARQQFQQYLSQVPASTSTSTSSSSRPSSTDLTTLLQRSAHLTQKVDELHSQLSNTDSSSHRGDDPQLFWSTLTLQTNLRALSSQLQRHTSDRKAADVLAKTQHNVDLVESLLRLLSISGSEESSTGLFTAPVKPTTTNSKIAERTSATGVQAGYEYYKQQTLSALDDDDTNSNFALVHDDDAASDTDSILTDPEIHLTPSSSTTKSSSTPLVGLTKDEEDELRQYERAPKPSYPPAPSTSNPTSSTAATAAGGDTTILQSDRATHEALSSELLRMASILKSNSLAFADSLERDRLLLEKAGTDLGQNLDLMTRTRGRLGVYSKKARSMGWFTLSAILVVIVSWMLMFLLIRLT